MASVKSKDTTPELTVRRTLHALGYRFRLHRKDLPGRPDIVLPRHRIVIFVHGCFWHGHRCRRGRRPTSNLRFWNTKLDLNIRRDRLARRKLKALRWQSIVIWECQTRKPGFENRLGELLQRYK